MSSDNQSSQAGSVSSGVDGETQRHPLTRYTQHVNPKDLQTDEGSIYTQEEGPDACLDGDYSDSDSSVISRSSKTMSSSGDQDDDYSQQEYPAIVRNLSQSVQIPARPMMQNNPVTKRPEYPVIKEINHSEPVPIGLDRTDSFATFEDILDDVNKDIKGIADAQKLIPKADLPAKPLTKPEVEFLRRMMSRRYAKDGSIWYNWQDEVELEHQDTMSTTATDVAERQDTMISMDTICLDDKLPDWMLKNSWIAKETEFLNMHRTTEINKQIELLEKYKLSHENFKGMKKNQVKRWFKKAMEADAQGESVILPKPKTNVARRLSTPSIPGSDNDGVGSSTGLLPPLPGLKDTAAFRGPYVRNVLGELMALEIPTMSFTKPTGPEYSSSGEDTESNSSESLGPVKIQTEDGQWKTWSDLSERAKKALQIHDKHFENFITWEELLEWVAEETRPLPQYEAASGSNDEFHAMQQGQRRLMVGQSARSPMAVMMWIPCALFIYFVIKRVYLKTRQ